MNKLDQIKKYLAELPVIQKEIGDLEGILGDIMKNEIDTIDIVFRKMPEDQKVSMDAEGDMHFHIPNDLHGIFRHIMPHTATDNPSVSTFQISNKLKVHIMVLILEEKKAKLIKIKRFFERRDIPIT